MFYHAGCNDGFCAALIASRVWPTAQFIPVHYYDVPPDVTGERVLILDFCFDEPTMARLKSQARLLEVLDHHEGRREITQKYGLYSDNKSGAMMAWEWFNPHSPAPDFVQYIQDYDLWKFEMFNSREWSAGINVYPRTFEIWEDLWRMKSHQIVEKGEVAILYEQKLVDSICKHAVTRKIFGYEVPCVNTPVLVDLVGEQLCQGKWFSASYYDRADGMRKWSLRSMADNSGVDVKTLALTIPGGGGHRNAAGFQTLNPDVLEIK